jgi:acetylornithine deacetylase/succinyl-diaminopimelate desuccinylase-like protein
MENMKDIFDFIENNKEKYLSWLYDAVRIPSISAHGTGVQEMSEHLRSFFKTELEIPAELIPSPGFPFLAADLRGDTDKTILFYNHYDVQPVDPVDEWESDPFEPIVKDGRVFARGISDNKGSLFARLCAVHAWRKVRGGVPIGVKFFYEGEEETGSPHLNDVPKLYPSRIQCDAMLWEGGSRDVGGPLHVGLGVKGLAYFELRLKTAKQDMHSAMAGIAPNAAWRMVHALSTIKNERGDVLMEGFSDDMVEITEEDKFFLENMTFQEEEMKKFSGVKQFNGGLTGYALKEQLLYKPTANIAGFVSGYGGPGGKTVLPASVVVKMDFRLVPNMTGEKIFDLLKRHFAKHGFEDIEVEMLSSKPSYRTDPHDPFVQTVIECANAVYGIYPAVYRNLAGTTGMYDFCTALGAPAVLIGVSNEDSRQHAPNENMFIDDYVAGIKMVAAVMGQYAAAGKQSSR